MSAGMGFHFTRGGSDLTSSMRASQASQAASQAAGQVRQMEAQIERLLMITEALWTFMKQQHGYTDDDLIKAISTIDMRDGRLDGKVREAPDGVDTCTECGRAVGARHACCIYCGTPLVRDPFDR